MNEYRFPGIRSFVGAGGDSSPFASDIRTEWFLARIGDALSQACHSDPSARGDIVAHAVAAREALSACLQSADAAIADACRGLGLANPLDPVSEATPGHRSNDGPRRPRRRDQH